MFTHHIRTEAVIPAKPSDVWATFSNWNAYRKWSSFLSFPEAPSDVGKHFKIQLQPKGGSTNVFTPELLRLEPGQELRWRGKLWNSNLFFVGEHYFQFETTEDKKGTKLVHGENFQGMLIPLLGAMLKKTEGEFQDFNEQLKQRVLGQSN